MKMALSAKTTAVTSGGTHVRVRCPLSGSTGGLGVGANHSQASGQASTKKGSNVLGVRHGKGPMIE